MARLANVPESVLELAAAKSGEFQNVAEMNHLGNLYVCTRFVRAGTTFLTICSTRRLHSVLESTDDGQLDHLDQLLHGIEAL